MKKISRLPGKKAIAALLCVALLSGCGGASLTDDSSIVQDASDSGKTLLSDNTSSMDAAQNPELTDKPRLFEEDEEEFSPERALMKANQVQNEGDAVIYPTGKGGKNPKKEYSIFVYMVGSDLEASYGYATRDMQEMEDSGIDFSANNLVIYAGGSRMWKSDIPSNQNNVLDMSREGEARVVAATKHTSDMGAPETLAAFLEYGVEYYPADHYALIFWDHGGGSVYGYGNDTLYSGDSLLLSEMDSVMAASPFGVSGKAHLDWVGFDACLMSTAENAAVWSKYADYLIASEETEPGDGWCYSFLDVMNGEKSTEIIGKAVVDAFREYYEAKKSPLNDPDITLALMDLGKTAGLIDSINALVGSMEKGLAEHNFPELARKRTNTKMFGLRDSRSTAYDLLDIRDLAEEMAQQYPDAALEVTKVLNDMIVYSTVEVEGACGLSVYFPGENRELYEAVSADKNRNMFISERFAEFAEQYAEKWTTAADVDWTLAAPQAADEEITLQLTEEQAANMDKAMYTVFTDEGDGFYRRTLCDVEAEVDENNVIHIAKNPSLIFAVSDYATMSVPCAFVQTDKRGDTATYDSIRSFLCYGYEMTSDPYDWVTATVEETNGEYTVKSFHYSSASASTGGKNTVDLKEYMSLQEYMSDLIYPSRSDDGTMLPYNEWESQSGGLTIHYMMINDSLHFTGRHVDELKSPTAVQIVLRDINGAAHGSELCSLSEGAGKVNEKIELGTENGKFTFEKHGEEVWLIDYRGNDSSIEIPAEVEGHPVTRIDDNAISGYGLRDIVIPEGVKSMGYHAISYVSSMTELTLPSTLEDVCKVPIGSCTKLEKIQLRGKSRAVSVRDGVLFSADGKTLIKYPEERGSWYSVPSGTEIIAPGAFYEARIYEIEFPETLKNIENFAFEGCVSLDSLNFPDSLERIGAGAFSGGFQFFDEEEANLIERIEIGANLVNIGLDAFTGYPVERFEVSEENPAYSSENGMITSKAGDVLVVCPAELGGSVIVPDGVVGLTAGVFEQMPFDTVFYFPDSLVRMNINDFPEKEGEQGDSRYEFIIYCSEGSAAETFAAKNKLNYVSVEPGELNLKSYTNQQVPALNGVLKFRVYADHAVFTSYTGSDSSISIPAAVKGVPVTEIGDGEKSVYEHKNSIMSMSLGFEDDTAETSNLGIYKEENLKHVDIPATVTCINDGAFSDYSINIDEFVLPDHLEKLGPSAFGGRVTSMSIGSFSISENNQHFMTLGGVLFTKDGKTLLRFPTKAKADLEAITVEKEGRTSRYVYQIPQGCETVGKYAFADVELIKVDSSFELPVDDFSVRFSPDVVLIDNNAFKDSEINIVVLNEGLETIGDRAFYSSKLENKELILPSTVTAIGDEAFALIYREEIGFNHIELPEDLKSLGKSAFSSYEPELVCDDLVIGKKLTKIAEGAFEGLRTSGFVVDSKNSEYSSEDGCLLDASGEKLITVPQGRKGEFRVPDSVKRIEKFAFYSCNEITDIYIGPGVSSINPQAVYLYDKNQRVAIHGQKGSEAEHFAVSRGFEWKEEAE